MTVKVVTALLVRKPQSANDVHYSSEHQVYCGYNEKPVQTFSITDISGYPIGSIREEYGFI